MRDTRGSREVEPSFYDVVSGIRRSTENNTNSAQFVDQLRVIAKEDGTTADNIHSLCIKLKERRIWREFGARRRLGQFVHNLLSGSETDRSQIGDRARITPTYGSKFMFCHMYTSKDERSFDLLK